MCNNPPLLLTKRVFRKKHEIKDCIVILFIYSPVKIWKDPPQIATKTKLPPSCREFCVDFKNKKFTRSNQVKPFQISKYLWGPREKPLGQNSILYFFQNYEKIYLYLQPIWFISITIPYEVLSKWLDVWVPNYMKDFTQKYANSGENIFDFILPHGSVFIITMSIFNRYDWLMA